MLFKPELLHIKDFFFNPDEGIKGYLNYIDSHTHSLIKSLSSSVTYKGEDIKLARNMNELNLFLEQKDISIMIVYGNGGSGKSGLMKDYYSRISKTYPCFVFKAMDFDMSNMLEFNRIFGDYQFDTFLEMFESEEEKVVIIDSAEKVFAMDNKSVLLEAIQLFVQKGWKIFFTIRTIYKDNVINYFLQTLECSEFLVADVTESQLESMCAEHGIPYPQDTKMRSFLCNLFHFSIYSGLSITGSESFDDFKKVIWNQKIKDVTNSKNNLDVRREIVICKLALSNANRGASYYEIQDNDDYEAITALKKR